VVLALACTAPVAVLAPTVALASSGPSASPHGGPPLVPGNLLVSTSEYQDVGTVVAGQTQLPTGCGGTGDPCTTAVTGGDYPFVFNNDTVDGSFGVTSKIVLQEMDTAGNVVGFMQVPNTSEPHVGPNDDQMVTSYSSKSEMALNLSPDGQHLTFMGYEAPVGAVDVSNSNTPGAPDSTNPVTSAYYRVVAQLDSDGTWHFTKTNAYSGNNGRAAIFNDTDGVYYTAGNAGNGGNPEPSGVVFGAGGQLITPANASESAQTPGQPTPVGSFNAVEELPGYTTQNKTDKVAKDNNFRGMTISNNVLYFTKGSGGNGVNTVYFVDTSMGHDQCKESTDDPTPETTDPQTTSVAGSGSALAPASGVSLPTSSNIPAFTDDASENKSNDPGTDPHNMCILNGFPTTAAKSAGDSSDYPFGLWFAGPNTLYVADEGAGDNAFSASTGGPDGEYTAAAASTTAGLQKWTKSGGSWHYDYTLQSGLDLGQPYTVPSYPKGLNDGPGGTGLPWAPATDGLRNLTGQVNPDGTVTIWAVTSTVSGSGDQGADPNSLVRITDNPSATTLPGSESFQTVATPKSGRVYRGVSFTPGTSPS
jgi:hypothetical protein